MYTIYRKVLLVFAVQQKNVSGWRRHSSMDPNYNERGWQVGRLQAADIGQPVTKA
jgi:hypothetical protein